MAELQALLERIAKRDPKRSEATLVADIRQLLLEAPLNLQEDDLREVALETPVKGGRRIDIETGSTILEVKRDLDKARALELATEQLRGYLQAREHELERRFSGLVTDGKLWVCYASAGDDIREVTRVEIDSRQPVEPFLVWLDGVLATARDIKPTPAEVELRLGHASSAHQLDRATLMDLYDRHREDPGVQMKRKLWARLLTTALGTQFKDDDELFIEHTLLVNSAEIIAHAVVGLDTNNISPSSLLSGASFAEHGITGVVEPDFFDWVVEVSGGEAFIRALARRLCRFAWATVEHDVLKVLYESVITPQTRKKLGEYYTPDWLAEKLVADIIDSPLEQRVLDPACGSGTFVFHAVRRYLDAANTAGWRLHKAIAGVTRHVFGMDLHPVAVTLARVTYLLAIGRERLTNPKRGAINVPIYLGDSMQWQQSLEITSRGQIVVQTDLIGTQLSFPDALLADSATFDQLVDELATKASARKPGSAVPKIDGLLQAHRVAPEHAEMLQTTFATMCSLHDQGRDHIWGYYVRNLLRPTWLARPDNRVDVLIGNPPWLAYRHMPKAMQKQFSAMSKVRGLWQGSKVATHQDLSALFAARAIQLYLRVDGRFAFVMPNSTLDRNHYSGFRSGRFDDPSEVVHVGFGRAWDLRRLRPHFFPRAAAVVFGRRAKKSGALRDEGEIWSGRIDEASSWAELEPKIERVTGGLTVDDDIKTSDYKQYFRQGATVVPRMLFFIERLDPGPLGMPQGQAMVRSVRSSLEKPPWRDLPALKGPMDTEFITPVVLSEHVLPYRTTSPAEAVIAWDRGKKRLLQPDEPRLDSYKRLSKWWRQAAEVWNEHRSSDRLSFVDQLDYHGKLSKQFPVPSIRVVYTASGMHLCAAQVQHNRALIDSSLYWCRAVTVEEAHYLCAILNAACVTELVRPHMSYGKDERHIHKHVWKLPVPLFDAKNKAHTKLAELGEEVEEAVAELELDDTLHFAARRRRIREFLAEHPTAQKIEAAVAKLLRQ